MNWTAQFKGDSSSSPKGTFSTVVNKDWEKDIPLATLQSLDIPPVCSAAVITYTGDAGKLMAIKSRLEDRQKDQLLNNDFKIALGKTAAETGEAEQLFIILPLRIPEAYQAVIPENYAEDCEELIRKFKPGQETQNAEDIERLNKQAVGFMLLDHFPPTGVNPAVEQGWEDEQERNDKELEKHFNNAAKQMLLSIGRMAVGQIPYR